MRISSQLEEQIKTTIEGLGHVYVGAEVQSDDSPLMRIYVEGQNGVPIDLGKITAVSRQLNALLDVESPWKGRYRVEVSSPGLDRRLFSVEDFRRFEGAEVKMKLHRPFEDRRNWVGIIKEIVGNDVVLEVEGVSYTFAYDAIEKAHLVPKLKW